MKLIFRLNSFKLIIFSFLLGKKVPRISSFKLSFFSIPNNSLNLSKTSIENLLIFLNIIHSCLRMLDKIDPGTNTFFNFFSKSLFLILFMIYL